MNLLLINADQLRHDCLGFRGLRGVKTPNLDALAGEGIAYTRAFTPVPVCAPARQALLCGRHPDSFGAMWNYDMIPSNTVQPDWCWTKSLSANGYVSAYLGRFHVSPDLLPADFGYDRHISWAGHKELMREKYAHIQYDGGWLGETSPVPYEDSGTHWMADRACEVIGDFAQMGKPWHIWVDYEEPHLPCRPSEPFASMYDPKDIPPWDGFDDPFIDKPYCHRQQAINWKMENTTWADLAPMVARYYALITQLDDAIGRILRALKQSGQDGETIIAFTSDHGDMCGSHRMLDKHYVLYDDIVRVPLIVRHPGARPRISDDFVSNCLDLPASFIDWLGLNGAYTLHGRPLALQEDPAPRAFITASGNGQQFGLYNTRMIRDGRIKYVWNMTDIDELYDLAADPGEKVNRIADPSLEGEVTRLRALLHGDLIAHDDLFMRSGWLSDQLLENRQHLHER